MMMKHYPIVLGIILAAFWTVAAGAQDMPTCQRNGTTCYMLWVNSPDYRGLRPDGAVVDSSDCKAPAAGATTSWEFVQGHLHGPSTRTFRTYPRRGLCLPIKAPYIVALDALKPTEDITPRSSPEAMALDRE